jgi:hypothetical protein
METASSTTTVVCPGCHTSQETPATSPEADPLVLPCQQCQATLVLIPKPIPAAREPTKTSSRKTCTTKPAATLPASRSAQIAIAVLSCLAYLAVGATIYGASYGVKQLDPYKVSESFARQHLVLKTSIGEPMTFGWFPSVQLSRSERTHHADVAFSVTGPQGAGQVALSLDKTEDRNGKEWRIREARYQLGDADMQPLWIQFPGDLELLDRLEAMHVELDQATNNRDIETMMKHIAPDARFRFIIETPPNRSVRTFHNREEFRREMLAGMVMTQQISWQRHETDFRLAPDGRTATGNFLFTDEVIVQGQHLTFTIIETMTYSLVGGRPLITSIDGVQQLKKPS